MFVCVSVIVCVALAISFDPNLAIVSSSYLNTSLSIPAVTGVSPVSGVSVNDTGFEVSLLPTDSSHGSLFGGDDESSSSSEELDDDTRSTSGWFPMALTKATEASEVRLLNRLLRRLLPEK